MQVLREAGGDSLDWNTRTEDGRHPVTMALFSSLPDVLQVLLTVPGLDLTVLREAVKVEKMEKLMEIFIPYLDFPPPRFLNLFFLYF